MLGAVRATTYCTGNRAVVVAGAGGTRCDGLEEVQQRRAVVPVELVRPLDHVGPGERRDRHEADRADVEAAGAQRVDLGHDLVEALLAVADEIHLVDRHHHVRHAEQGREQQVARRLIDDAVAGVDQHDGELGRDTPVTMLRVYCTWPGQSAITKSRCGVEK